MPARGRIAATAVVVAAALLAGCTGSGSGGAATTTTTGGGTSTTAAPGGAVEASAVYLDPAAPVEDRVEDLLARMTLAEKIGQMTQVDQSRMRPGDVAAFAIGSVLSGGGGYPPTNNARNWAAMVDGFQREAMATRLGIPLLYGVDAIHGHNNVRGATIFPQEVGLGAAGDPDLVRRVATATAAEMAATGIHWNFAPVLAVPQDIRWGRSYEAYGEDTDLVATLGAAAIEGMQGADLGDPLTVAATPKHYVGDGGTTWGSATTSGGPIDQGDTRVDEETLRAVHLAPYLDALAAGAEVVMATFSSWNGTKVHADHFLLTDLLKGELGFDGFVVSDFRAIDQISPDYSQAVVTAINAGIDMNMVPYDYPRFIGTLTTAVGNGDVTQERIDDAVRRILRVKFELGLFEQPYSDPELLDQVGSDEHRALAREAVRRSLVLLENNGDVLPLGPDDTVVLVAGIPADDIGIQSGGWTIEWQGRRGTITPGTTILAGLEEVAPAGTTIIYAADGVPDPGVEPDVCIGVVGERPYAEYQGDSADLALPQADLAAVDALAECCERLVVVIVAGRPVMITDRIDEWDTVVMAWLPGSEGGGVADMLFGREPFTGRLPYTWPRTLDQLPLGALAAGGEEPLFPFGFGFDAGTWLGGLRPTWR